MRFCLIAENQSLDGEALHDVINARLATGPCHFHVVVPATGIHDLYQQMLDPYEGEVTDSHVAIAGGPRASGQGPYLAPHYGAETESEIGDAHPIVAIANALGRMTFDEIIVSTPAAHSPGGSGWAWRQGLAAPSIYRSPQSQAHSWSSIT